MGGSSDKTVVEIHIRLAGQDIGPFSEKQVRQYMGEGLVTPTDLASHGELTDWQPVESLLASLPPPVISTPVFADPSPLTEDGPQLPPEAPAAKSETPEPEKPSEKIETPEPDAAETKAEPEAEAKPVSEKETDPVALSKRPKSGKTAVTIEPLRPTSHLPPVTGFVPKDKAATKPLPKVTPQALRDIGKIENSPATTEEAAVAGKSSGFEPPPIAPSDDKKEKKKEKRKEKKANASDDEAFHARVFRFVFLACCALALILLGLAYLAFRVITAHPAAPKTTVLPSSPVENVVVAPVEKPVADIANPKTADDFCARGLKRQGDGDIDSALSDFEQALTLDPKNITATYRRGLVRQLKGNLNGALADYNTVLAVDTKNADAYGNRAYVKQTQGDLEGALADYHQTVQVNPKSAIAYYNVGLIKVKQGDLDGAIVAYNYALDLDPKMAIAYYNRGNAKNTEGNLDGAIADYTQAVTLDPKIALAYCNRGFARQTKGDVDGALSDYSNALALNSNMGIVYYNRGLIRVQQGDLNGAIDDSTHAIDLNAKDGPSYCNRGLARMGKSDYSGAQADLRKFCELSPRDTGADTARLYLWVLATRNNPRGTADQDLSKALLNDWNSPPEEFTSKIGSFLLGHMREDDLIANAASPDPTLEPSQYCKAWYFAGMKRLLAGDKKTAVTYFQKCVATDQKDYCEHIFARAELEGLGQGTGTAPKAVAH